MSTVQKLSVAAIATVAVLAGTNSANAALFDGFSITATPGPFTGTPVALPPSSSVTGGAVVSGSLVNNYAQPLGYNAPYLTVAPIGSNVAGATGSATITLPTLQNDFNLYWGSIDPGNSISFLDGSTTIATITGADLASLGIGVADNSSWSDPAANQYINFLAGPGVEFNKVVLATTNIAFESGNFVSAQVPEPTTILGLLAFGFLGAGSIVKRTSKTA